MSTRLVLDGIEDMYRALRTIPDDLTGDAGDIVINVAEQTAAEVRGDYPLGRTGNLRAGVSVSSSTGRTRFGVVAQVKSAAPHVYWYEQGTKVRTTRRGANRGRMPAAPAENRLVPAAIRWRGIMIRELVDLLRAMGFTVASDAGI